MTPVMLKGLIWIAEHEPVGTFPADGPSNVIRRKLECAGLIERAGRGAVIKYQLSPAGRHAMAGEARR